MFNKRYNRFQLYKVVFIISVTVFICFLILNLNIINNNIIQNSSSNNNQNNDNNLNINFNIKYIKRNQKININNIDKNQNIIKTNNNNKQNQQQLDTDIILNRECEYVDLVYTWVNGSDPELLKLKSEYLGDSNFQPHRFRDIGGLKYSLRSVKKFAPWIKNIYIITANQIPDWFDTTKPGNIKFIFHEDYYYNKSHLPTFNSNSIESNFFNLPEQVSNCFLYLNDDVFFRQPVYQHDFFDDQFNQVLYQVNERVRSSLEYDRYDEYFKIFISTNRLLDSIWNETKERVLPDHGVQVFNRKILLKMADEFRDPLISTSSNRKRESNDIPISFVYNQFAKKYSNNYTIGRSRSNLYVGLWNENDNYSRIDRSIELIKNEKVAITVCVNDGFDFIDDTIDYKLSTFYEFYFPEKLDHELY